MTITSLPWFLPSSQDPISTQGSGMGHLCPWGDDTALQNVAAPSWVCISQGTRA